MASQLPVSASPSADTSGCDPVASSGYYEPVGVCAPVFWLHTVTGPWRSRQRASCWWVSWGAAHRTPWLPGAATVSFADPWQVLLFYPDGKRSSSTENIQPQAPAVPAAAPPAGLAAAAAAAPGQPGANPAAAPAPAAPGAAAGLVQWFCMAAEVSVLVLWFGVAGKVSVVRCTLQRGVRQLFFFFLFFCFAEEIKLFCRRSSSRSAACSPSGSRGAAASRNGVPAGSCRGRKPAAGSGKCGGGGRGCGCGRRGRSRWPACSATAGADKRLCGAVRGAHR